MWFADAEADAEADADEDVSIMVKDVPAPSDEEPLRLELKPIPNPLGIIALPSKDGSEIPLVAAMKQATNAPSWKPDTLLTRLIMGLGGAGILTELITGQTAEKFRSSVQPYNDGQNKLSKYDIDRMYNAARRRTLLPVFVSTPIY